MSTDIEDFEFDGERDEFDDLISKVCIADTKDDVSERGASKELLAWVSYHGEAPDKQEAIDIISQKTGFNKSTASDWYQEINSRASLQYLDVDKIIKIHPYDPNEDVEFEFHVTVREEPETFRIESSELTTPKVFVSKVLELCDMVVEFDDWNEEINTYLEKADIEERMAEPLTIEHDIARSVIEDISRSEATFDKETFKNDKRRVFLAEFSSGEVGEVWVHSSMLNSLATSYPGEISRRRLRNILDHLLIGNAKRVRTDDDLVTVWRFDPRAIEGTGVVDMDTLIESAEDDQ